MSLRVDDGRSRGRSKSPGRRDERSRSRDVRAPSPAVVVQTRKSSKKYYSDESESDSRSKKKGSKKYYDDSSESDSGLKPKKSSKKRYDSDDSDSDPRAKKKKSSRRHHDESDSDDEPKKKSSKKRYSDSDSESRSKKKTYKKYYDRSDHSSSSSEDDRKGKHKVPKHARKGENTEESASKYERERHGSYASLDRRERPAEPKRHLSNSSIEGGEKYRQLSMPGGFTGGHSPHPQYALLNALAIGVSGD